MKVSIGIPAFNEEKNIGRLLNFLLKENFSFNLKEIIVVASGCTDRTEEIGKKFVKKNEKIILITEGVRKGKCSAVNIILGKAKGDLIVFIDADNKPMKNSINKLIKVFSDESVGAASGRPVPRKSENALLSYIFRLIWNLHHEICKIKPVVSGELCVIRTRIIDELPYGIINDDGYFTGMLRKIGKKIVYVPKALTYTEEQNNIYSFTKKRRRIARGYAQLRELGLNVNMPLVLILKSLFTIMKKEPSNMPKILIAIMLESIINILAYYDTVLGKKPYCWRK